MLCKVNQHWVEMVVVALMMVVLVLVVCGAGVERRHVDKVKKVRAGKTLKLIQFKLSYFNNEEN